MSDSRITKLLIANRGEIALRIQRACNKLGIKTVTIASEADKGAYFARQAEQLVVVGPAAAKESYLAIDKILKAAKETGCDALHPGYGFLSESSIFAKAVLDAGLIWVGPTPESIEMLGSKTAARAQAISAGVPVTPGSAGGESDSQIVTRAEAIGFPVIIKAVGGGGGRGMRVANTASELSELLPRARAEAEKNFGNGDVFIEKYIIKPRHVEVQVFGDHFGNALHFGTRDCSTQRRHQKLVEEAPAPNLSPELRSRIEQAAVKVAKQVRYANAGTAEFLVSGEEFYFLEMNTRIQVEHPVTEAVTGVDLVELQLRVAQGEKLPMTQEQVKVTGHAIEFRIYAEDPDTNFSPSIGPIAAINRVKEPWLREDFGFEPGDAITPYYDAMLSKLIVSGDTRQQAIERSLSVLGRYSVGGLRSNVNFFRWLLRLTPYQAAPVDIGFLEREFSPESMRALRASEIKDPAHRAPTAGALFREQLLYAKGEQRFTIEIVHRADGTFEAGALDRNGKASRARYRRASNGRETAVKALIEQVIEVAPQAEMFE